MSVLRYVGQWDLFNVETKFVDQGSTTYFKNVATTVVLVDSKLGTFEDATVFE